MKLHRLRLKNFRGIADREVIFADVGVTVVAGRNEAGKSSMVEALDALLELPASSKSRGVKALSPAGRDVGTEVEAEMSSGSWRFTYFKRFNRSVATELTVHSPAPEQHSGRDAEARAKEILSDAMDLALFRAVRLMQSDDPELLDATGSAALTRALDRAVGSVETADGAAEELLAAVGEEYGRYYTEKAGRPTGELAQAEQRVAAAQSDYAARARGIDAVARDATALENALARKKKLAHTVELRRAESAEVDEQLTAAATARAADDTARQSLKLAMATVRLADREVAERSARRKRLATLRERESEIAARLAQARLCEQGAAAEVVVAEGALAQAHSLAEEQLASKLTEVRSKLTTARAELAANGVDAQVAAAAQRLAREIATSAARLDAAAASFAIEALGEHPIQLDGQPLADNGIHAATGESVIEIDGVVRVVITAGANTGELARRLRGLRDDAEQLCATHDLPTLDAAQARADARGELTRRVAELSAELADPGVVDAAGAVTEAQRRLDAQRGAVREHHAAGQSAAAELARVVADIDELSDQIDAGDAQTSDEQAADVARDAKESLAAAERVAAQARTELEVFAVADLDRRRCQLDDQLAALGREIGATEREVVTTSTRIEVCRTDNRLDELHDAAAELADAEHALARIVERAAAARLLYLTLRGKRQESHARYADPFRQRLEELSAPLFGPGVRFGVEDDLTITSRTLDGITVPYEALSGGAREQLGLVARLACAMLVDDADGVPVIIDDALGNSDNGRTETMADVLTQAGKHSQVIVLTCVPERYAHVDAASTVNV